MRFETFSPEEVDLAQTNSTKAVLPPQLVLQKGRKFDVNRRTTLARYW